MTARLPQQTVNDVLCFRSPGVFIKQLRALNRMCVPPQQFTRRTSRYDQNRQSLLLSSFRSLGPAQQEGTWWALYKPAFAPMKASPADPSYPSVQSFIAQRGRQLAFDRPGVAPPNDFINFHVLYDLPDEVSGVCVAYLSRGADSASGIGCSAAKQNLNACTQMYELLVHGHLDPGKGRGALNAPHPFPFLSLYPKLHQQEASIQLPSATPRWKVVRHGFYGSLPVSVIQVHVPLLQSSAAPDFLCFATRELKCTVVGDVNDACAEHVRADYPRLMCHLGLTCVESVHFPRVLLRFCCLPCLSRLVAAEVSPAINKVRLGDGQWRPV